MYYKLDGHTPVKCEDVREWAKWFEQSCKDKSRQVTITEIENIRISTVFLAVDHNFIDGTHPILFETMIFGGANDQYQRRYSTWEEAEAGHAEVVKSVQDEINQKGETESE